MFNNDQESQKHSWKVKILLPLFAIFFVIILLEIGIRTYDLIIGRGFFSETRNLLKVQHKPVKPFKIFGPDFYKEIDGELFITSSHGELYPLKKKDHSFRIVCLGGSTTLNFQAFKADKIHYPLLVQRELNKQFNSREKIEVINAGFSAYSTAHSLITLIFDVLNWNPDLIIVSHNYNDLSVGYWENFRFDYSNKYSYEGYLMPNLSKRNSVRNVLFQHSQLYWFVQGKIYNLLELDKTKIRRKNYGIIPPQKAMETFKKNLQSIIHLSKKNNINVLLSTQPLQSSEEYFLKHISYKSYNNLITYPFHKEFIQHHHTYNNIIEKTAQEEQVWFIDNNKLLENNKDFFTDYIHYSTMGVRKLSSNYSNFIIKNKLIKE